MNFITFISYDSLGNITQVQTTDADCASYIKAPTGGGVLQASSGGPFDTNFVSGNYIHGGAVTARIAMSLTVSTTSFPADGTSEATITGIPNGASVTISGAVTAGPETITDGELIVTSTTSGAIQVSITMRPAYQDWSTTLNAT